MLPSFSLSVSLVYIMLLLIAAITVVGSRVYAPTLILPIFSVVSFSGPPPPNQLPIKAHRCASGDFLERKRLKHAPPFKPQEAAGHLCIESYRLANPLIGRFVRFLSPTGRAGSNR